MNKYSEYKDSGVEWIGEIPKHWEVKKIKHITECLDSKRIPLSAEQRGNIQGDYPYWGANSIVDYVNNYLIDDEVVLVGEDGAPFFDKSKSIAFYSNEKIWVNNHIHILKPNKINAKLLMYILNSVDYKNYITGSTRDKLTQGDMNNIAISIPPTQEQEKIANYLDKKTSQIENLITKKEELIETLKKSRSKLISETVTKGLDKNVVMKNSGVEWIGEIPEHWEVSDFRRYVTLKQGLQIAQEKRFENNGKNRYVYITVKYTNSNKEDIDTEYIEKPNKSVMCWKEDVLLARTGATGKVVTNIEGVFHNNFFKIIYDKQQIIKDYLVYFLKQETIQDYLKLIAGTTTIPDLNHGAFLSTKVTLPNIFEQIEISNYLDKKTSQIDNLISKVEEQIEVLKKAKQKLITEVVTGKIDVRNL